MAEDWRVSKRREELVDVLTSALAQAKSAEDLDDASRRAIAAKVVEVTCSFRSPDDGETLTELLTIEQWGRGGGSSAKPGNVLLKPGQLVVFSAKAVLAAVGVVAKPWLAPFAVVVLWNELLSRMKVEIQEREATVAWTLWVHKDKDGCVPRAGLLALVNAERAEGGRGPLSQPELDDSVTILERLRVIKASRDVAGALHVSETVRAPFR